MEVQRMRRADYSSRKRSFDFAIGIQSSNQYQHLHQQDQNQNQHQHQLQYHPPHRTHNEASAITSKRKLIPYELSLQLKRRSPLPTNIPTMPVRIASLISSSYPSFMSVYGNEEEIIEKDAIQNEMLAKSERDVRPTITNTHSQSRSRSIDPFLPWLPHHQGSISSLTTASTESSPTTVHSTFDSPILNDTTPASSPESATSALPMSTFGGMSPPSNKEYSSFDQKQIDAMDGSSKSDFSGLPSRNIKKLSLNTTPTTFMRPSTSSGMESSQPFSAPTSPFKEPLRTGRRKPANLTIWTPGLQRGFSPSHAPDVPPTPGLRPCVQQVQSSPHLGSFPSPISRLSAGLNLSLPSLVQGHSRPGSDSSVSNQSAQSSLPGLREEEEASILKSQEVQERGYPDGPVLIYESGLYLYLEPTAEEARKFDTVINVAKEVKNPFEDTAPLQSTVMSVWRGNSDRATVSEPQTAISEMSFKSAWEWQSEDALVTPTTPRAIPENQGQDSPEYIHVPWDHNSEILEDLYALCCLIDERLDAGKKVLIHCQLGVSRSASLVIAYGLYKSYQNDFHSMYMTVKEQSQWVGPNMSLIYQLTDFKSKIEKGRYAQNAKTAPQAWFKISPLPTIGAHTDDTSRKAMQRTRDQETGIDLNIDRPEIPQIPKRQPSLRLDKELPPLPKSSQDNSPTPAVRSVPVPAEERTAELSKPLPFRQKFEQIMSDSQSGAQPKTIPLPSLPLRATSGYKNVAMIPPHRPRSNNVPGLTLNQSASKMDLAMQDVPDLPSLLSPRVTEFTASPFGINSVGDLEASGLQSPRPMNLTHQSLNLWSPQIPSKPPASDPRSPHQPAEHGQIVRNIDEYL